MLIAEAKVKLEKAGYLVEYAIGNANVYVRTTVHGMPWKLWSRNGTVSDRSVKMLLNKKEKL